MSSESDTWSLTVVRLLGLREGKSWRPIVTVQISEEQLYETVLGSDGQSTNLKTSFLLRDASHTSQVHVQVWQKSQSKKKGKKRTLVATASISLGEISKTETGLGLPLSCSPNQKRSRRNAQGGAHLVLKVCAPPSAEPCARLEDESPSDVESETTLSPTLTTPLSPTMEAPWQKNNYHHENTGLVGYSVYSDDEDYGSDHQIPFLKDDPTITSYPDTNADDSGLGDVCNLAKAKSVNLSTIPRYTTVTQISVPTSVSFAQSVLDSISPYRDLRESTLDSEFENILSKLVMEWYFVGGALGALAALNAAVFGFSSGTMFEIDTFARHAVVIGGIAAGIGIWVTSWLIFFYSGADGPKFQRKAKDIVYGEYFFFSLSSRFPALCMFISASALMIFLLCVAWTVWRAAVLVMCVVAGIVLSLQFLVYGFGWCLNTAGALLQATVII